MPTWIKRGALVMVVLLVVVAGGVAFLIFSDSATPVDVDEAVDRYRDEEPSTTPSEPEPLPEAPSGPESARPDEGVPDEEVPDEGVPDEGVYVYSSEGHEHVDILGGSTHTYPDETTVTIRHTDCGLQQRWAPLDERWDDEELCTSDLGRVRRSITVHHEFFSISDEADFRCEPGYVVFPVEPEIGDTWSTRCESVESELTGTGEVMGFETRTVGDRSVETVHVRISEQASGGDEGPSRDDYWFRTSDGLLIERSSSVESRSDSPVGTATYTEQFTLRLVSLAPRT